MSPGPSWLRNSPYVSGIRGMGLMVGVGVQGMTHKELKDKLMAEGLPVWTSSTSSSQSFSAHSFATACT